MAKFPQPPEIEALRRIAPEILTLAAGTTLARLYFAAGDHSSRWNRFRHFGPTAARWDPHVLNRQGLPVEQEPGILYCAPDVDTCIAEVFQATRRIDRTRDAPWLVVFALKEDVKLLDLRGSFATTLGASTAIHSGPRSRSRAWARALYEAYPELEGIHDGASMNGHAPAVALNERAKAAMPDQPLFHRALNDDALIDILQHIALRLSYGLRWLYYTRV